MQDESRSQETGEDASGSSAESLKADLPVPRSAAEIQGWMIDKLAEALGVNAAAIEPTTPLASYGTDSIVAFSLTGDLADWLGCELPATLLWDHRTIEALALYLEKELQSQQAPGRSVPGQP